MADVNITKVYLLNIPLENDYKHTFYFASKTEQYNYFIGKVGTSNLASYSDFSYQRKDSKMRIPVQYDEAIKFNYVMYQNTAYSSKWFYAFIIDYEFKGEDSTNITIETDVFQTWLNDYTVNPSFIDREHVINDTVGLHTVPENLEMGEHECVLYTSDSKLKTHKIVLGTTIDSEGDNVQGGNYNGLYSGVKYYAYPKSTAGVKAVNDFLKYLEESGKADSVQCLFIAPEFITEDGDGTYEVAFNESAKRYEYEITGFSTPTVKNKKLLTFPYRYLLVSNNNGGSAVYKYERFMSGIVDGETRFNVAFYVSGVLTPGCSIRLSPKYYNGVDELPFNNEEGLNLGKYPICNWNSDAYTNWLTQNSVNIGLSLASGLGQVIGGGAVALASGGLGMAVGGSQIIGGVSSIAGQLAQIHQMSFTPPQSKGNINCGDVITAENQNTFHFYQMCIKNEYIKIIDDYFTMFGYKTNRVKTPYKNHRQSFWYTKTIDVNITGTLPIKDLQKLKEAYNTGITFWKNKDEFKNYGASNEII